MIKKIAYISIILLVSVMINACEEQYPCDACNPNLWRTADPCKLWQKYSSGKDSIRFPELQNGKADHADPSAIIYWSIKSALDTVNNKYFINPLLMLIYLENNQLLRKEEGVGDFEFRLMRPYEIDSRTYNVGVNGFYPQVLAVAKFWHKAQKDSLSFAEAQTLLPFTDRIDFKTSYAHAVFIMNLNLKTKYDQFPDDQGYYSDFHREFSLKFIQDFLSIYQSPLAYKVFSHNADPNSIVKYNDLGAYCQ